MRNFKINKLILIKTLTNYNEVICANLTIMPLVIRIYTFKIKKIWSSMKMIAEEETSKVQKVKN